MVFGLSHMPQQYQGVDYFIQLSSHTQLWTARFPLPPLPLVYRKGLGGGSSVPIFGMQNSALARCCKGIGTDLYRPQEQ